MATLHYIGVAEPGAHNWAISFPSFPGVVTTGDSFADLMRHACDALASIVDALRVAGEALPPPVEDDDGARITIPPTITTRAPSCVRSR